MKKKLNGEFYEAESLNIPLYTDGIESNPMEEKFLTIKNPCRGMWLAGKMDENKRSVLIAPIVRQMANKGWSMCIYDHHYPMLVNKLHSFQPNTVIHFVNFDDAMYSDRVNLLKYVNDKLDAIRMAETIVSILNEGQQSCFQKTAENFLAACIWIFCHEKQMGNNQNFSLPHVLSFVMEDYKTIFQILMTDQEFEIFMQPFKGAYIKKDFDQIQVMLNEFRVKLAKWCSYKTFWIGSGEDFPLDFPNRKFPKPEVLLIAECSGTQQEHKRTSTMGALLLNTFLTLKERQGNGKQILGMVVDDMEQMYLHDIDRLFGTMRYNRIAVALGFQTRSQLERYYGKEKMNILFPIIPTFLCTSIQHTGTQSWLWELKVLKRKKDIPEGYVYCLQKTDDVLAKVDTAKISKDIPLKTSPRFTDKDEMDRKLKENYNRIVSEVKDFCKNKMCSNNREKYITQKQ